jgi:hypothetical protein
MLVCRLLESTNNNTTHLDSYNFLREARAVTLRWLGELSAKLEDAEVDSEVLGFQQRVCEMAAICRSTYDVSLMHLAEVLSSTEDYSVLISCSVTLYDNQPPKPNKAAPSLRKLLSRDRRLAHKVTPRIIERLIISPRILDLPVSLHWNDYHPGIVGWGILRAPNARWVSTATLSTAGRSSQRVHINLLEGRLLVDGRPLGRLPREYVAHPTYLRLFGRVGFFDFIIRSSYLCHNTVHRKFLMSYLPTLPEWFLQHALTLKEIR